MTSRHALRDHALRDVVLRGCSVTTAIVVILSSAGCGSRPPPASSASSAGGAALLNSATPASLIAAVTAAGLPAVHPRDTTAQVCKAAGCVAAEQTDSMLILKFPSTGVAQTYDGNHPNAYAAEDVVVVFEPTVEESMRRAYEQVFARALR